MRWTTWGGICAIVAAVAAISFLASTVGEKKANGDPLTTGEGFLTVLDFGAAGDNNTDDTEKIQDALDSGNGPIYLPAQTYKISGTLTVPSGSGLFGPGTLHQTADVTTIKNLNGSGGNTDIYLEGLIIDKDFVNNSLADGIHMENVTNLQVIGLEVTGLSARNGIEILTSSNFLVRDCYFHDFSADATGTLSDGDPVSIDVIYSRSSRDGQIIGNRIENMIGANYQSDGIYASNSTNLVIADNRISNVGEGIDIGNTDHTTIVGNVVENADAFGIKVVNGSSYNTITGNSVNDTGIAGITVARGTHASHGYTEGNVVSGNVILNTGSRGTFPNAGRAGIKIEGDNELQSYVPRRNLIVGNMIIDNQSTPTMHYGILEDEFTLENTYADNKSYGHIHGSLSLYQ